MNLLARRLAALGLLLASSGGEVLAADVTTPPAPLEVSPGAEVVVPFRVRGDPGERLSPTLDVPEAWTVILPEEPYELSPFGAETRLVMVRVPTHAPPGEYVVRYGLEPSEARAVVSVAEVRAVQTEVLSPAERVRAGDRATFQVVVRNDGNVPSEVELRWHPDNLRLDDEGPERVVVEPGESAPFEVSGVVGDEETEGRLVVRVTVDGAATRALTAGVSVIPANGRVDRWWRLPLSVTLWNLTGNGLGPVRTTVQGEVSATGFLDPQRHLRLDLTLRGPDSQVVPGYGRFGQYGGVFQASFDQWSARLGLGDTGYRLTALTERGIWGRGVSLDVRYGTFGLTGYTARERYVPDAPAQYGAAARFFAGKVGSFTLGSHLVRLPGRNQVTVTHEGYLPLLRAEGEWVDLLYEVAVGNLSPGGYLDVRGRFPSTAFGFVGSYGGPDFPGEFGNRLQAAGNLQQRAGPLTIAPSGMLTMIGVGGAGPKPWNGLGGLGLTLAASDVSDLGVSWSTWGRGEPGLESRIFDWRHQGWLSAAWRTPRASVSGSAGAALRTTSLFEGTAFGVLARVEARQALTKRVEARVGVGIDTNLLLRPGSSLVFDPSVGLSWRPGPGQMAFLTYLARIFPSPALRHQHVVQARMDVRLPWKHWIRLRAGTHFDAGPGGTGAFWLDAMVGYAATFGIPTARRKDLVTVSGRVTDAATGEPIPEFPVELDGYGLVTGPDGTYEFLAEPKSRHFLEVPLHSLPEGQVVLPRAQYDIGASGLADQGIVRDIQVAKGGSLRVRVVRYELEGGDYLWTAVEPSFTPVAPLRDEPVVVYRGDVVLNAYTDGDGIARFDRLPTGEWTIALRNPPPEAFEVEGGRVKVVVEPNGDEEILVRVLPKVTRVQFVDDPAGDLQGTPASDVVREFRVVPPSVVVGPNGEAEIRAELVFTDGRVESVADQSMWTSNNLDVATAGKGFVIGVAPGTATIEVQFDGLPVRSVAVEVVELPFVGLVIDPAEIALVPGGSTRLTARSIDVDGRFTDVSRKVEWVSEDPEVAVVGTDGTVFAKKEGKTRIRARSFGISAFPVEVTVAPNAYAPIEEPEVTPPTP